MTALAYDVFVYGTLYTAGTDHSAMPTAVVDEIRNPGAWVGASVPALTTVPYGKARIISSDLTSATKARAALGITVALNKGHVVPTGSAPTAAAQASAGTGAAVVVAGKDTAGSLTLTAGSAAVATGNQVVVTFNEAYAVAPVVVLTSLGATTFALGPYVAAVTTTTFTLGFSVAPTALAVYAVNYVVIGK